MSRQAQTQSESFRYLLPSIALDVLSRWMDIVLAVAIAVMGAYLLVTQAWQPEYSMTACYAVMTKASTGYETYSTGSVTYTVATTFQYLIDSEIVLDEVEDALGVDTLNGTIETTILEDTNIMYLTVTADSPQEAYEIMNALEESYQDLVDVVLGSITLDVLESATIPTSPSNLPNRTYVMVVAGLSAAAFMIVLLSIFSYIRDTVRTENDFREKLNIRCLGTIPREKRRVGHGAKRKKGQTPLITRFPVSWRFTESIEKFRSNFEYRAEKNKCKVILVTSTVANEGKSTVAVNLALSLAKAGRKVVFVDGDLRNPTGYKILNLDIAPEAEFGNYLQGISKFVDVFHRYGKTRLFVVAGKRRHQNAAELLGSLPMSAMVRALREAADYVIIDMPPAGAMVDVEEVSGYADGVILVVRQNQVPVKMVRDVLDSLDQTNIRVLGCVFNEVRAIGGVADTSYHSHGGWSNRSVKEVQG